MLRALLLLQLAAAAQAFMGPMHRARSLPGLRAGEAEELTERAASLREEIARLESELPRSEDQVPETSSEATEEQPILPRSERLLEFSTDRMIFEGAVPLDQPKSANLPAKITTVEFTPWVSQDDKMAAWRREQPSIMFAVELDLPLGLIIEDSAEGRFNVVAVNEGSAADNGLIRVGDILRAFSTVGEVGGKRRLYQQDSIFNLLLGGEADDSSAATAGSPYRRVLAPADKEPFEGVMAGLKANGEHPEGPLPVLLLFERSLQGLSPQEIAAVRSIPRM